MATPIYGKSGNIIGYQTSGSRAGSSNFYNLDENGNKVVNSYSTNPGSIKTPQESGLVVVTKAPTYKKTTATTKDGQQYTFDGDNWVNYAKENGITSELATAISYPSYVDAKEANRYLNEQADRYGVKLNSPVGAYESAVSKEYALNNNLIPDYSTPFASAAAGQTGANLNTNGVPQTNTNFNAGLNAYGIKAPEYQTFDYEGYFDNAGSSYKDSVEAQRAAAIKALEAAANSTNLEYDKAAQEAYIANYFANKQTEQQLKESGIKGGLTESSLLQGNANFENAYNQNEEARLAALREIALQQAQTNSQYDADINAYLAQLELEKANFGQNELSALNSYNWNKYLADIEQANADRDYALSLEQLKAANDDTQYNRLQDEIALAYQLGDIEKLKALGYDTTLLEAQVQSQLNDLKVDNTPRYIANPKPEPEPEPEPENNYILTQVARAGTVASDVRRMYENNSTKQEIAAYLAKMVDNYGFSESDAIKIAESYGINLG